MIPSGVNVESGIFPDILARAVEAATADPPIDEELTLEVLVSRIVSELYNESPADGGSSEELASLLELLRLRVLAVGLPASKSPTGTVLGGLGMQGPPLDGADETAVLLKTLFKGLQGLSVSPASNGEPAMQAALKGLEHLFGKPVSEGESAAQVSRTTSNSEAALAAKSTQSQGLDGDEADPGKVPTFRRSAEPAFGASADRSSADAKSILPVVESRPTRNLGASVQSLLAGDVESEVRRGQATSLPSSRPVEAVMSDQRSVQLERANVGRLQEANDVQVAVVAPRVAERSTEMLGVQSELSNADRMVPNPTGLQVGTAQVSAQSPQMNSAGQELQRPDVAAQIVRAAQITIDRGGGTVRLQLDPPELGRINLSLRVADGGIVAMHMVADSAEARAIVQSQLGDLQTALQDKGFEVGSLSISVDDQERSGDSDEEAGSNNGLEADSGLDDGFEGSEDARNQFGLFQHDGLIDYSV